MLFFDGVVDRQGVAEMQALREECAEGHAGGPRAGFARLVEDVPGVAEVIVVGVHHDGEAVVGAEILGGEFGEGVLGIRGVGEGFCCGGGDFLFGRRVFWERACR